MDKNKILDAAAKLVAKGAYDKAIKEYQKVLDADPRDVRVLHKLGELYEKKNDNAQAATFFTRVADGYASDGFSMKAIALYKKVLKLDPNLIDVNIKLAELHQQHQLMSEAMGYYQAVANHHDRKGDVRASLDILKKMVELDPDNVASRIKLADLYARESLAAEAAQEYRRAAEHLRRNNRVDDYLRVAERLATLEPQNTALARDLAQEYLGRGDQKRALAKLQICFKTDPRDVQTLTLLAQAFSGLGQTSKTLSVYKELARIHQDAGRTDEAGRVWAKVAQLDRNDPDLVARNEGSRPGAAAPAAPPAGAPPGGAGRAPPPGPPPSAGGLSRDQLAKLLTETDVYVKYGLHDKALEHLRRIFSVDPENLDAHEKAYQIYASANNAGAAAEQLLNVLRLCTRRAEVQRAQPYLVAILQQNPHHPEVAAFLSVLRTGDMPLPEAASDQEQLPEDAILVDSSDEEIIVADAPEDALANEDLALVHAQSDLASDEVVEDTAFADDEPLVASGADEPMLYEEPASAEIVVEDPALEAMDGDEPPTQESPLGEQELPTRSQVLSPALAAMARNAQAAQATDPAGLPLGEEEPELLSTGAYESLGDDAGGWEDVVESDVPAEAPAGAQAHDAWAPEPEQSIAAPEYVAEDPWAESPVEAPEEEEPAAEECDEAAFFLDQGLYEEAREILETVQIAFPGHPRATALMERMEAEEAGGGAPQAAPSEDLAEPAAPDAFDLAAQLADELDDLGEQAEPASAGSDDYQVSVEEVFSEFKRNLEKVVKPEDVETHYDLGIAYKEMGLYDDAIGEFVVARQGCVGKRKEVDCLTMIGLLQMMKGDASLAIEAFKQALHSGQTSTESALALRYELATAWESAGHPGRALYHLQAVAAADPGYRGVGESLERLSAVAEAEVDEDPPASSGTNGGPHPPSGGGAVAAGGAAAAAPLHAAASKSSKVGYI